MALGHDANHEATEDGTRMGVLIAGLAVKEGVDAWRGEGCCVAPPLSCNAGEPAVWDDDCCD